MKWWVLLVFVGCAHAAPASPEPLSWCDGDLRPGDAWAAVVGEMVVAVSCIEAPATASLELVSRWADARAREEILSVARMTEVDAALDTGSELRHVNVARAHGVFDGHERIVRASERRGSLWRMVVRIKMPLDEAKKAAAQ